MYEQIDADPAVRSATRFFGAAAVVTNAFASGPISPFMGNLSRALEGGNLAVANAIRSGQLFSGNSPGVNDRAMVRFEQTAVQRALNRFAELDPKGYASEVSYANRVLNSGGSSAAAAFGFDKNFASGLNSALKQLGGKIDFANQKHREVLGVSIINAVRSSSQLCTSTGTRIRSC